MPPLVHLLAGSSAEPSARAPRYSHRGLSTLHPPRQSADKSPIRAERSAMCDRPQPCSRFGSLPSAYQPRGRASGAGGYGKPNHCSQSRFGSQLPLFAASSQSSTSLPQHHRAKGTIQAEGEMNSDDFRKQALQRLTKKSEVSLKPSASETADAAFLGNPLARTTLELALQRLREGLLGKPRVR